MLILMKFTNLIRVIATHQNRINVRDPYVPKICEAPRYLVALDLLPEYMITENTVCDCKFPRKCKLGKPPPGGIGQLALTPLELDYIFDEEQVFASERT